MKIIKVIFYFLIAFGLIACTGVFLLFQTFDTDQYLPKFTQKASSVLGRPVSVGHVGLGLSSRGITLDVWPLIIADDPDFTSQPFIKIDRARISLDLRALILKGKVQITKILLQSPQVHFIRSQEGGLNASSVGQTNHGAEDNTGKKDVSQFPKVIAGMAKQSLKEYPQVHIKSITIQDASISYIDQSQGLPLDVWLKGINAGLKDFSLSKPLQLSFSASLLVFKSTSLDKQDNPVFKKVTGVVRLDMPGLQGDIVLGDGVIKDFNIMKEVLSRAVRSFGGLDDMVNKLGTDDTAVERAEAKFSYHDKTVFIDDFQLKTNILELNAQGSVDQGFDTDLKTMLRLNTDISTALVNQLDGLKYLCDDNKRIAIGGTLKGVYPHLKYRSDKDFKKKSKKVFNAVFRQLLGA
jgi:hypothetical protein